MGGCGNINCEHCGITKQDKMKKEISKKEEKYIVQNPITGKQGEVTIGREGMNNENLALVLADKKLTQDQKDHAVSLYLVQRGKDSASMLVDLFRYKGQNTTETRAFKSQIRMDYEMLVNKIIFTFSNMSRQVLSSLDIPPLQEWGQDYYRWHKKKQNEGATHPLNYSSYYWDKEKLEIDKVQSTLVDMALRFDAEAEVLSKEVERIKQNREKEKGWGIYVDKHGRAYDATDPDLQDAIKKDKNERDGDSQ